MGWFGDYAEAKAIDVDMTPSWTPQSWIAHINILAAMVNRAELCAQRGFHVKGPERFLTAVPNVICADCLVAFPDDSREWWGVK